MSSRRLEYLIITLVFGLLIVSIITLMVTDSRIKRLCDERGGTLIDEVCIVPSGGVKIYKD